MDKQAIDQVGKLLDDGLSLVTDKSLMAVFAAYAGVQTDGITGLLVAVADTGLLTEVWTVEFDVSRSGVARRVFESDSSRPAQYCKQCGRRMSEACGPDVTARYVCLGCDEAQRYNRGVVAGRDRNGRALRVGDQVRRPNDSTVYTIEAASATGWITVAAARRRRILRCEQVRKEA